MKESATAGETERMSGTPGETESLGPAVKKKEILRPPSEGESKSWTLGGKERNSQTPQ